jgi:proteasome beta subunit
VALPLFPPERDPGPDFVGLLRMTSGQADTPARPLEQLTPVQAPHGTTVVALRYLDGVVMAGDRRATAGNIIAHHAMQKVFPADRFSAVAIAGTAGMAIEMVRLAGFDTARRLGRIFNYDVTGGHYEDTDFQATGSGGRDARSTIKLGWREGLGRDEAVDLAIQSLYDAADEDSATGGPDLVRGIYPLIAVVDAAGYREVPEDEVAERFGTLIARRQAERAS